MKIGSTPGVRLLVALLVAAACAGLDQLAKAQVRASLRPYEVRAVAGGLLEIHRVENPGIVHSLGRDLPAPVRHWGFTVLPAAAAWALVLWAAWSRRVAGRGVIAAGLVAGGLAGNVADRLAHDGRVLDLLLLRAGPVSSDIFNLADLAILAGLALAASRLLGSVRRRLRQ